MLFQRNNLWITKSNTEVPIVVYFLFMGILLLFISVSVANAVEKYQDRDIEHGEQYMREYSGRNQSNFLI